VKDPYRSDRTQYPLNGYPDFELGAASTVFDHVARCCIPSIPYLRLMKRSVYKSKATSLRLNAMSR
jgi:hypothetical protein